jgi:hypothetical protein
MWAALAEMDRAAFPEKDVRDAAVIAMQSAGDRRQRHPHLQALVPEAVWTRAGRRLSCICLDPQALTRIFQAKVFRMLVDQRRLGRDHGASPEQVMIEPCRLPWSARTVFDPWTGSCGVGARKTTAFLARFDSVAGFDPSSPCSYHPVA